ncbi:MAG: carbohydrate binding family 9 domain-containing protein, partial [Bacteroidia bacterium]|nr:carbohydrate binding family 9 domain-containing protein [Bacteroidia bacterium]
MSAQSLPGSNENTDAVPVKIYETQRISVDQVPLLDGIPDEGVWDKVSWAEDFTVNSPNNGDKPKRQTKFKILYDDKNLYLAYRAFHEDPSNIENRLGRRDYFPGDWVEVNIDSYNDKNTAFSFTASVSGVKSDEFVTGNGNNWDSNWNPIWYSKTNIDEEGWTAEIQIPMSQLRFGDMEEHVWGFNVMRRDFGNDERSTWQFMPQNVTGWVSNFGELHGIKGIKPVRQLEIQPFVVADLKTTQVDEDNPFEDGSDAGFNFGIDGKYGLTSDLTLDFTINPDFGQVEADPSALNLDGFQIFFDERRPFFVENANLFEFRVSNLSSGGPFGNDNLFYSRRIGSSPKGRVFNTATTFSDRPDFTTIIGAAKVSGKTENGWSISVLESVTAEETEKVVDINNTETTQVIEPLSNYFVAGLSKDLRNGATIIGGKLTGVHRKLEGTGLEDQFHDEALTGGVSLFHSWKGREWQLQANYIFSNVKGTVNKILDTQTSFEHYFQRPDADHLEVREDITSLGGNGGTFSIGNFGGKDNLSFQTGVTWRSPGLELNDIGFLNTADEINHGTWIGYRFPKPFSVFRSLSLNLGHRQRWTTGGEYIYNSADINGNASFKNYWNLSGGISIDIKDFSQKALFGGPMLRRSPGYYTWIDIDSDQRKKFRYGFNINGGESTGKDKGAVYGFGAGAWFSAQTSDRLSIVFNPTFNMRHRVIQNVAFSQFNGEDRYITGTVSQKTFSASVRVNYSFTPNLTLQYWGQPYVSKGNYEDYKYITDPLAPVYTDRFQIYEQDQISFDQGINTFFIDEDLNGDIDYEFRNPEFNFLQFRSNLVLRWEYKP